MTSRNNKTGLRPAPSPPGKTKSDIFNPADYVELDVRACQAPFDLCNQSLTDLVNYLIQPILNDELGRVRVIYRWITAQDLSKIPDSVDGSAGGKIRLKSAMDYLAGIKEDKIGYWKMFQDMCRIAKVQTAKISGFVKHAAYEIGDQFDGEQHKSSWTAVLIGGSWHLIDVHWSSKSVIEVVRNTDLPDDDSEISLPESKKNFEETKKTRYQCDESYFLTNPDEFIYTHLPEDEKWQLLERPVNLEEFTEMAFLKPEFFQLQLSMIGHKKCVERAPEGEIKIQLGYPSEAQYKFMQRLSMMSESREQNSSTLFYKNQLELNRFVFMENANGTLTCDVQFPAPGRFKLELFCLDASSKTRTAYPCVCAYVIEVDRAKKEARPYPENSLREWGPGWELENAGLEALTHHGGLIVMKNGEAEIRFKAAKGVEVLAQLSSNFGSREELSGFVKYRSENRDVIINVKAPEPGDYALHVYAKNKADKTKKYYTKVCSYLLVADEAAADVTPFHHPSNGRPGPTRELDRLGLKVLSHPSAQFEAPGNGEVEIVFGNTQRSDLVAELLGLWEPEKKFNEFLFVQKSADTTSIRARFPEPGTYSLNVYGKPTGSAGSYSLVFGYVVDNHPASRVAFPECYSAWDDDCCSMQSPEIGAALVAGTTIPFAIRIPKAVDVAVVDARGTWTQLTAKDSRGSWKGGVDLEEPGELKLVACYGNMSDSYDTLMAFQVEASRDVKAVSRKPRQKIDVQRRAERLEKKIAD